MNNLLIDLQRVLGCEPNSRVYCESYNALLSSLSRVDEVSAMSDIDLSALALYIGKYVEQEINCSLVQLMRKCVGIPMPQYYGKRVCPSLSHYTVMTRNGRCIDLNGQCNPGHPESLSPIMMGDAYYAFSALKSTDPSICRDYPSLRSEQFANIWRDIFHFRNRVAHSNSIISRADLIRNFECFCLFLKYMPELNALKMNLSGGVQMPQAQDLCELVKPKIQPRQINGPSDRPLAKLENMVQYQLLQRTARESGDFMKLNDYIARFNWHTQTFEGEGGKVGMKDPSGNILVPARYDNITFSYDWIDYHPSSIPCIKGDKMGLVKMDGKGTELTDFIYENMWFYSGLPFWFFTIEGCKSFGIMSTTGEVLIPCELDAYSVSGNTLYFRSGDLWGMWQGILIEPLYDSIEVVGEIDDPLLFVLNGVKGYVQMEDGVFVPKSEIDALEDEDMRHDRMLEFICDSYLD